MDIGICTNIEIQSYDVIEIDKMVPSCLYLPPKLLVPAKICPNFRYISIPHKISKKWKKRVEFLTGLNVRFVHAKYPAPRLADVAGKREVNDAVGASALYLVEVNAVSCVEARLKGDKKFTCKYEHFTSYCP